MLYKNVVVIVFALECLCYGLRRITHALCEQMQVRPQHLPVLRKGYIDPQLESADGGLRSGNERDRAAAKEAILSLFE